MSASDGADAGGESDHAYFQAVEEIFIRLRGAPLLLSPADYRVASRWHQQGIPLDLVREVLEELFEGRRRRGVKDSVSSLRYCAKAVERAWEAARELAASGHRLAAPELEVTPRLEALAATLERATTEAETEAAPGLADELGSLAARLRSLTGDPEAVEAALARLDDELIEHAETALGLEARAALDEQLAGALAGLAARLPAVELERARRRLHRQLLRTRLELPVLSLFAPEAEG